MSTLLEDDLTVKSLTIGTTSTGSSSASSSLNKTAAGTASYNLKAANVLRGQTLLDASENLALKVFASDGTTVQGSLTIAQSNGMATLSNGATITTGGLTVTAGGATVTAGGLTVTAGGATITAGGLTVSAGTATFSGGATVSSGQTLTVTGATVVGLHEYITVTIPSLVATKTFGVNCPVAGTITRIGSCLNGAALTTGDAIITGNIAATPITDGAITITQSGSAVGDLDVVTPSAANTVAVGSYLNFVVTGTNDAAAASAELTITILRSA